MTDRNWIFEEYPELEAQVARLKFGVFTHTDRDGYWTAVKWENHEVAYVVAGPATRKKPRWCP